MGISGLWTQRAARDYTGATRWGNGYDPVHAVHDNGRGRVIGTKENLYPLGEPSDVVAEGLTSREIDWVCEDYVDGGPIPGEVFRYQDDRPRWDKTTFQFRGETNSAAMGEQPAWGPYFDDDPTDIWPRSGPTGGMQRWLDVSHGENTERQRAIAVPTAGVSGGWLGKVRAALARSEAQDPAQEGFVPTLNTSPVQGQGVKELSNERAVARGTDGPRSSIQSRTAGMVQKVYGQSFGMGGGPGTPDMAPFQQTAGLKRPWVSRTPTLPPEEPHFMNTMEGRVPFSRTVAADPYQGDPEAGPSEALADDWGF
jgi:hypothetical protein